MPSKLTRTRRRRANRRMFIHAAEIVDSARHSGCCSAIGKASRAAGFHHPRQSLLQTAFGDLFSPTLADLAGTYVEKRYLSAYASHGDLDARAIFSYWMGPAFDGDSRGDLRRAREIRVLALLFAAEAIGGES